ncbi:uncharacterized protein LOC121385697 [Gigantopelta aegis]|uniref:uncharacterized protein LOC121385697 n=1 Tax=Gigantopelta aegis TaxID=1735272 RepID=UPI001B88D18C|nr:uncharacterized protein LOC121385697 [Gigantopelta aegis]
MNRNRKIPKEVIALFDKYIENNVRSLHKEDAIKMLMTEFGLDHEQAQNMFETFDKDKNGIMSIWEFQQFYMCAGTCIPDIVAKFQEIDKDGSGRLDVEEAREGLKSLKTATGRTLTDREIEFFIQTTGSDDKSIDLGHFTNLMYRLKLYKADAPTTNIHA